MALRLSVGLVIATGVALPPEPGLAASRSVFHKLERFLTGHGPKARSQNRKGRPGKKSQRQAAPKTKGQQPAPKGKPQRKQVQAAPQAKERQNPPAAAQSGDASPPIAPALPAVVALPARKPGEAQGQSENHPVPSGGEPSSPPVPTPAPRAQAETAPPLPKEQPSIPPDTPAESNRPTPPATDEAACRTQLVSLGVEFADRPPEADLAAGCSIPHPVFVTRLSKTVALDPGGLLNCAMTAATARFIQDVVQPIARKEIGSDVTGVGQASAYVCRTRHGRSKMSEHAFGNALDISRFSFADGSTADVGPVPGEKQGRFLAAVRAAACGPFKTVLGPGSDPDHATHFHLDLEQRRHGGTFCQ